MLYVISTENFPKFVSKIAGNCYSDQLNFQNLPGADAPDLHKAARFGVVVQNAEFAPVSVGVELDQQSWPTLLSL